MVFEYSCTFCGQIFSTKSILNHHYKVHVVEEDLSSEQPMFPRSGANEMCPADFCNYKFRILPELRSHLQDSHGVKIMTEKLEFSTEEEFLEWKEDEEQRSLSRFAASGGRADAGSGGARRERLVCQGPSGEAGRGGRPRQVVAAGPSKVGTACPASISLQQEDDGSPLRVTYHKTHFGHETDAKRRKRLTKTDREAVAEKLKEGASVTDIVAMFRKSRSSSGGSRLSLLTRKDVENIGRSIEGGRGGSRRWDKAPPPDLGAGEIASEAEDFSNEVVVDAEPTEGAEGVSRGANGSLDTAGGPLDGVAKGAKRSLSVTKRRKGFQSLAKRRKCSLDADLEVGGFSRVGAESRSRVKAKAFSSATKEVDGSSDDCMEPRVPSRVATELGLDLCDPLGGSKLDDSNLILSLKQWVSNITSDEGGSDPLAVPDETESNPSTSEASAKDSGSKTGRPAGKEVVLVERSSNGNILLTRKPMLAEDDWPLKKSDAKTASLSDILEPSATKVLVRDSSHDSNLNRLKYLDLVSLADPKRVGVVSPKEPTSSNGVTNLIVSKSLEEANFGSGAVLADGDSSVKLKQDKELFLGLDYGDDMVYIETLNPSALELLVGTRSKDKIATKDRVVENGQNNASDPSLGNPDCPYPNVLPPPLGKVLGPDREPNPLELKELSLTSLSPDKGFYNRVSEAMKSFKEEFTRRSKYNKDRQPKRSDKDNLDPVAPRDQDSESFPNEMSSTLDKLKLEQVENFDQASCMEESVTGSVNRGKVIVSENITPPKERRCGQPEMVSFTERQGAIGLLFNELGRRIASRRAVSEECLDWLEALYEEAEGVVELTDARLS